MMQKGYENRYQVEMISIEDLVPQEHLLRQISSAVDFSKIYDFVEELYCDDNGRPSIDPVVLFKMVLIQHLYGLPSLRRTADELVEICKNCPTRHLCTESKDYIKTVTKHIWSDYIEFAEDIRHTPEYADLYKLRKEKIERVFADAKEKHAMRYTLYTGLAQVTNRVRLKFATMNLKKLAKWKWKRNNTPSKLLDFIVCLIKTKKNPIFACCKVGFFDSLNRLHDSDGFVIKLLKFPFPCLRKSGQFLW